MTWIFELDLRCGEPVWMFLRYPTLSLYRKVGNLTNCKDLDGCKMYSQPFEGKSCDFVHVLKKT